MGYESHLVVVLRVGLPCTPAGPPCIRLGRPLAAPNDRARALSARVCTANTCTEGCSFLRSAATCWCALLLQLFVTIWCVVDMVREGLLASSSTRCCQLLGVDWSHATLHIVTVLF